MKIFLTGITGFLGQHIAQRALSEGHEVLGLRRATSRNPFTEPQAGLQWVCSDDADWTAQVNRFRPDVLIHGAWGGVEAAGRNDAAVQQRNVELTETLLGLYPYKQLIGLGSQDEYGELDALTGEDHPLRPVSEYAKAKIRCARRFEEVARQNGASWQWLRLFSLYGPGQTTRWLIPGLIDKCLGGAAYVETTPGEQVYSYLHVADFARAVVSMLRPDAPSGVFNLSSSRPIQLRALFDLIKELTTSDIEIRRTLPYRPHQTMVMLGDARRFATAFGAFEQTTLEDGLRRLIADRRKARPSN